MEINLLRKMILTLNLRLLVPEENDRRSRGKRGMRSMDLEGIRGSRNGMMTMLGICRRSIDVGREDSGVDVVGNERGHNVQVKLVG